jgi:hypothetical protein
MKEPFHKSLNRKSISPTWLRGLAGEYQNTEDEDRMPSSMETSPRYEAPEESQLIVG